jgi:acetylglutamate kinase
LPVVVAVFAGLVNKRIVAAINAAGGRAVGLSGADGRVLQCQLSGPELGFVGEPERVDARPLQALRDAGMIPVISPIGCVPGEGPDQLVNVNADTVAGDIAAAVGARELVFLTDVDGVRDADNQRIPGLTAAGAEQLVDDGVIAGGMIPKVQACLHAVSLGVPVQIVDGRQPGILLDRTGKGTTFGR